MKNEETFKMTYSAKQQEEIEKIRNKYIPQEPDKMEQLRMLDAGVEKKATMKSIAIGLIGALDLGIGMSMVMTDFGKIFGSAALFAGIVIGVIGLAVLGCAYPCYHYNLKKEREKIAPQILQLTDELAK